MMEICFICGEEINTVEDEEVFYNKDGDPLCEQCYSESKSKNGNKIKLNEKLLGHLEDYCNRKGISKEEAITEGVTKFLKEKGY
jgi:hypothetical protein